MRSFITTLIVVIIITIIIYIFTRNIGQRDGFASYNSVSYNSGSCGETYAFVDNRSTCCNGEGYSYNMSISPNIFRCY